MTNNKNNTNAIRPKIIGFFVEIIAIYYIFTKHNDYFIHSRSKDMLFPYPPSIKKYKIVNNSLTYRLISIKNSFCLF